MLLFIAAQALAAWPEDPLLSNLTEHGGVQVVDRALLSSTYRTLVGEIGTAIAPTPLPSATTGTYGFEVGLSNTFVLVDAHGRGERLTPWDRAVADESADAFLAIPTVSARKGLPMSTEIGGRIGWVAATRTGVGSIFGRVAIIENYKPLPDVTLHLGYSGYVGNDEIDVSVFDMGVTVGSRFGIGQGGENNGRFEPFATFDLLRVSATPTADADLVATIGAETFRNNTVNAQLPLNLPRVGGGFQITSGVVHFRFSGAWAWQTLPTLDVGMGVTF